MDSYNDYLKEMFSNSLMCTDNIIKGEKYRITILSERLVRLEYNVNGIFEDRPTQRVIYRNFPKVDFQINDMGKQIKIITKYFTLDYLKNESFIGSKIASGNTLKITLNNSDRIWYYGNPDVRNYGSINYSLDDFAGKLKQSNGLYSLNGFSALDDSNSLVMDVNGNFVNRDTGSLDMYVFIYRKDLGLTLKDYYLLTGYPLMIPRYALGNWWYKEKKYDTDMILEIVKKFDEQDIPLSVFVLGNKNENMDQIDISKLRSKYDNIKYGLTVNPINNSYNASMISGLIDRGISVFNISYNNINDVNNLAINNFYFDIVNSVIRNKRSVILSRNHNMGIHRMGIVLSGKTIVDWNTLGILPKYIASASNMGISYIANPIGGFYKGMEDFELYIRYIQFGVFSPILMLASDESEYYRREPWKWNSSERRIIAKYLRLRNRLIPYIYTAAYIYHKTGSPMVQPLYYSYPSIYDEPMYMNQYFFGESFLVCPITKKKNSVMNRTIQKLFIPSGIWYEFESGKKYVGDKYYVSFYKDSDYPVFCKEGSIIVMSCDYEVNNPKKLEVHVFCGKDNVYELYEDDGESCEYKDGKYCITRFVLKKNDNGYQLSINKLGNIDVIDDTRDYKIIFRNINNAKIAVTDGTTSVQSTAKIEGKNLIIDLENIKNTTNIKINLVVENNGDINLNNMNDEFMEILNDLEIETKLKEKIELILFGELPIRKKRIEIRKLKRKGLDRKYINMFLNLLEYINTI